jgi:hypothetical protein
VAKRKREIRIAVLKLLIAAIASTVVAWAAGEPVQAEPQAQMIVREVTVQS